MTYQDAIALLNSLTNYERIHRPQAMREMRLERMRRLCERLGNPQTRFRSILVAGTNGKGSICAMIYEILRQAGLRVGLYTSPHLEDVRERIRVNLATGEGSDWISEEEFVSCIERLQPCLEEFNPEASEGSPTYFEVLTAAACWHFFQRGVDVAVLEVGLGGRLDATNVVEQTVAVLGPIGLDHTDVLGDDLVAVTREKAGIIKPKGLVISAAQQSVVSVLLRDLVAEQECRLLEYGRHVFADVLAHDPTGLRASIRGTRGQYEQAYLPLLGRHQAENAAVAVAAVEALAEEGIPHSAVHSGLAQVRWPGRLEIIRPACLDACPPRGEQGRRERGAGRERPTVLLDGAHNPDAAHALRKTVEELWPGRTVHLVLGMSADKPVRTIGEILCPMASRVTCTKSRHPRACDPQRLAEQLGPLCREVIVIPDAVDAYTYVLNTADPDDLIVITGSLFLVGELRPQLLQHNRLGMITQIQR